MPRLFVAVDLPDAHGDRLTELRDETLRARWTPQEKYHLTLRFIGDVDDADIPPIETALAEVDAATFSLLVEGVGVLPSLRRPRVVYAGLRLEPALHALHDRVEQALRDVGLPADDRPFRPHVTLARLKQEKLHKVRAFIRAHQDFAMDPFPVTAFRLYESKLHPDGAIHTIRRTFDLVPGDAHTPS